MATVLLVDGTELMTMSYTDEVKLYVYDMSKGVANAATAGVVEAIYHTGVFVFGEEYSYGPKGIKTTPPIGERPHSKSPNDIERIGATTKSKGEFKRFVRELGKGIFKASKYDVLYHNCNIFSQLLCEFLCDVGIPRYILSVQEIAGKIPLAVAVAGVGGLFKSSKR